MRIYLFFSLLLCTAFSQTKWSKCKVDKSDIYECLDGEIKKEEFNKWYIAYECENKEQKHYYWIADEFISESADTPFEIVLSLLGTVLGTTQANYSNTSDDASEEIIPLIEERKRILSMSENQTLSPFIPLIGICLIGIWIATAI
tara:strand:+ start:191 stop:625 length:435 start_codon:yes stop_codon:yes gene_type:complete